MSTYYYETVNMWSLCFVVPVAGLYGLGWSLGWVYRGSKGRKQKVVFLVGVGIMVVMGLIPPWHLEVLFDFKQQFPVVMDAGHHFLFSPPAWESYPSLHHYADLEDAVVAPSIALSRLCVQWVVVAAAVGGILIVLRGSQKEKP
jgi:hypothetical protein